MNPAEITARVQQSLELAKSPNTQLVCKNTVAPETENITTDIQVCFAENSLNGDIDISHLIEDLSRDATMGTVTLLGPPEPRLAIHGSFGTKLFKILVDLTPASLPVAASAASGLGGTEGHHFMGCQAVFQKEDRHVLEHVPGRRGASAYYMLWSMVQAPLQVVVLLTGHLFRTELEGENWPEAAASLTGCCSVSTAGR